MKKNLFPNQFLIKKKKFFSDHFESIERLKKFYLKHCYEERKEKKIFKKKIFSKKYGTKDQDLFKLFSRYFHSTHTQTH